MSKIHFVEVRERSALREIFEDQDQQEHLRELVNIAEECCKDLELTGVFFLSADVNNDKDEKGELPQVSPPRIRKGRLGARAQSVGKDLLEKVHLHTTYSFNSCICIQVLYIRFIFVRLN